MKNIKKHMVYRFSGMLLTACIFLMCFSVYVVKADEIMEYVCNGLIYVLDVEEETAVLMGSESASLTKLKIPAAIVYDGKEFPIVGIEDYAFEGSSLKSAKLGANISYIGEGAFAFSEKLKSVNIPKGCKKIDVAAFFMCKKLAKVSLNKKSVLSEIGSGAFAGTAIKEFVIPNATVEIQDATFAECKSLKSVTIGKKLKTIGEGAFAGCNELSIVSISKKNKNFTVDENVIYNNDHTELISGAAASGDYKIGEGTIRISSRAFEGNEKIVSVEVPDSLEYVGEGAFMGCTSLAELRIIGGLKELSDNAFYGIEGLKLVQVAQGEDQYED